MSLLAVLLIQAAEGEALYKALREKIAAAPSIRVEFRVRSKGDDLTGELKLKSPDKWALRISSERPGGEKRAALLQFDGRRCTTTAEGPIAPADPARTAAEFRARLADYPLLLSFQTLFSSRRESKLPTALEFTEEAAGGFDGRAGRVLRYVLRTPGAAPDRENVAAKLYLDAKTLMPFRRETTFPNGEGSEEYAVFDLDAKLPDADFTYATPARLAAARAAQAARTVDLFTRYTGRRPTSLDELAARPKDLPEDVFWPEGGFPMPADPAGKPYALADLSLSDATGRAIGAPNERIRAHLNTRVRLQLLASTAGAWFEAYGEIEADLITRPEGLPWPEGGWVPGGALPGDIRLTKMGALLRIQAPEGKKLVLSPEEVTAMEAASAPRLSREQAAAVERACESLGADDLDARLAAETELRSLGEGVVPLLEARLKRERDIEAAGRLGTLLRRIPRTPAAWRRELVAPTTYVGTSGAVPSNERNASASLKTLASAQADFRANDRDGNQIQDFWTGDVAGLYALTPPGSDAIKLIEVSVMAADAAPLPKGAAGGMHRGVETFGGPSPKAGYFFQAMTFDRSAAPPEAYQIDTGGKVAMGKVHNHSRFGFCAFPAEYGATGTRTFIISEGNTVFVKDTQGEPVLEWPTDVELRKEWSKLH